MNRKEIVKALSVHFETAPRYLGAPSFAYEVYTADETYTVHRYGTITSKDGTAVSLEEIIGSQQSEEQVVEAEKKTPDIENLELSLPMEGHSGTTLKNIVNMISSKQKLITTSLGIDDLFMGETFAEDLSLKKTDTVEDFKVAVEELGRERCKGLTFDFDKNTYNFHFPLDRLEFEKINAFAVLATHINDSAKKQMRTSYKPVQDDNPKFAFRTWLIRLGMKGSGYKDVRKALLSNLEGNGAFRKPTKQEERG